MPRRSTPVAPAAPAAPSPEVDAYIEGFPGFIREMLEQMRDIIRRCAPEAEETMSYGMPAYQLNGMLVYFAAWKKHIGLYPTASGVAAFRDALAPHRTARGSIQFPLDQPLPADLIRRIVEFRVRENRSR